LFYLLSLKDVKGANYMYNRLQYGLETHATGEPGKQVQKLRY